MAITSYAFQLSTFYHTTDIASLLMCTGVARVFCNTMKLAAVTYGLSGGSSENERSSFCVGVWLCVATACCGAGSCHFFFKHECTSIDPLYHLFLVKRRYSH